MWVYDSGETEAHATGRACKIINVTTNPPNFVLLSQSFSKYMGYVLFDDWVLLNVVNKGRTLKTFQIYTYIYISSGQDKLTSTLFDRYSSRYIRFWLIYLCDVTIACSGYPYPCSGAFSEK